MIDAEEIVRQFIESQHDKKDLLEKYAEALRLFDGGKQTTEGRKKKKGLSLYVLGLKKGDESRLPHLKDSASRGNVGALVELAHYLWQRSCFFQQHWNMKNCTNIEKIAARLRGDALKLLIAAVLRGSLAAMYLQATILQYSLIAEHRETSQELFAAVKRGFPQRQRQHQHSEKNNLNVDQVEQLAEVGHPAAHQLMGGIADEGRQQASNGSCMAPGNVSAAGSQLGPASLFAHPSSPVPGLGLGPGLWPVPVGPVPGLWPVLVPVPVPVGLVVPVPGGGYFAAK